MKLLFINACMRGEKSRTLELSRYFIEKFLDKKKAQGEEWEVEEADLNRLCPLPQDKEILEEREILMKEKNFDHPMFFYATQMLSADYIVIGAPYWDLAYPAKLRTYFERVSVPDYTYIYDEKGIPQGQFKTDNAVYIMTAGGYTEGMNFGYEHVKGLFGRLFGISNVDLINADKIDVVGNDVQAIMNKAKSEIDELVERL